MFNMRWNITEEDGMILENAKKIGARKRILESAFHILQEKKDPDAVTVREVAARAEVGIGLINYHFESKDKMLMEAAGNAMSKAAKQWKELEGDDSIDPKETLFQMLSQLSDMGSEYIYLTKMAARFELVEGEVGTPLFILPYVKRITGFEDLKARLIAFALMSAFQSAVLRPEAFEAYTGFRIQDKKERDEIISQLINACLK